MQQTGLSVNASCWRNLPADKEVIIDWILAGELLVKDNEWFLG